MDPVNANPVSTQTATSSTTAGSSSAGANSAISSDFETFLVMLTAQLENQDPLNPMESSDYAVQLATFSSVEQQVKTNDLLADMIQNSNLSGLADLSSWVGKDVRSPAPAEFSGAPVALYFEPQTGAARAELVVRDGDGGEVQRLDVTGEGSPLAWTGVGADGIPLPDGAYSFEYVSHAPDAASTSHPVQSYSRVAEVRQGEDGAEIVLANGTALAATEVSGIRGSDSSN